MKAQQQPKARIFVAPGRKRRRGELAGGAGIRGENHRGGPPSSVKKNGTCVTRTSSMWSGYN